MKFTLEVDCDSAAIADDPHPAVASILAEVSLRVAAGESGHKILDYNGDRCGKFEFSDEGIKTYPGGFAERLAGLPDGIEAENIADEYTIEIARPKLPSRIEVFVNGEKHEFTENRTEGSPGRVTPSGPRGPQESDRLPG